jgi:hypothetical protein
LDCDGLESITIQWSIASSVEVLGEGCLKQPASRPEGARDGHLRTRFEARPNRGVFLRCALLARSSFALGCVHRRVLIRSLPCVFSAQVLVGRVVPLPGSAVSESPVGQGGDHANSRLRLSVGVLDGWL